MSEVFHHVHHIISAKLAKQYIQKFDIIYMQIKIKQILYKMVYIIKLWLSTNTQQCYLTIAWLITVSWCKVSMTLRNTEFTVAGKKLLFLWTQLVAVSCPLPVASVLPALLVFHAQIWCFHSPSQSGCTHIICIIHICIPTYDYAFSCFRVYLYTRLSICLD